MAFSTSDHAIVTDPGNTTEVALGASGVFTGSPFNWVQNGYAGIAVRMASDQDGSFIIESTADPVGGPWSTEYSVNYTAGESYVRTFFMTNAHYRVVYTNGATPQGFFAFGVGLLRGDVMEPRQRLSETVDVNEFTTTQRAVLSCELRAAPGQIGIIQCGDGGTILTHEVGAATFDTGITIATDTATNLVPTPTTNRQTVRFTIPSGSSADVYIGPDNTVTTGNGFFMEKGNTYEFALSDLASIWGITSSGTATVTWLQY